MVFVMECPPDRGARKLRTHRKSRQGCGNCKMRKVKCDEGKPGCKQCHAYNVICAYNTAGPHLQSSFVGTDKMEILSPKTCTHSDLKGVMFSQTIISRLPFPVPISDIQGSPEFCRWNLSLLDKFQQRTNATLGMGQHGEGYHNLYIELSMGHPFLLHIMLTLTIMHDRYLGVDLSKRQDNAMAFHWSQGAAMLNDKITNGVQQSEKDALWASAILLATLAFASLEAETIEDTWPLKSSSSTDLDWMKLIEGKKEIWKIADPHRADSVFYPRVPKFESRMRELCASEIDLSSIPPELVKVCGINYTSSTKNNPYLLSVSILASLNLMACTPSTFGFYFRFFSVLDNEFKRLLGRKDPAALLILGLWYAKVCHIQQWWLWRRANLECRAICRYLRLFNANNSDIISLVQGMEALVEQDDTTS